MESRSFFGVERTGSGNLALTYATLLAAPLVWFRSPASLVKPRAIVQQPDQRVGADGFNATYPAYSITLIVAPEAG